MTVNHRIIYAKSGLKHVLLSNQMITVGAYFVFKKVIINEIRHLRLLVNACLLWTSLGLNQGPPDYETNRMIVCDISLL